MGESPDEIVKWLLQEEYKKSKADQNPKLITTLERALKNLQATGEDPGLFGLERSDADLLQIAYRAICMTVEGGLGCRCGHQGLS